MNLDQAQKSLGLAIRKQRVALGVSQEAFAASISMHRVYYAAIERGLKNMSLKTLLRIAEGLGVSPSDLMRQASL